MQIIQNGQIICVISSKLQCGTSGQTQRKLLNYNVAMSLRGRAQRVLSELSYRELGNYSELKCALTQRFSPPERETAHKCEFRNRNQAKKCLNIDTRFDDSLVELSQHFHLICAKVLQLNSLSLV